MYVTIKLSSDPCQGHGFVFLCSPGAQLSLTPTPHLLTRCASLQVPSEFPECLPRAPFRTAITRLDEGRWGLAAPTL